MGGLDLTPQAWWMAAVLACGEGACLSHESAAQHRGIRPPRRHKIEVTVPAARNPKPKGIRVHRRDLDPDEITVHDGIPTTISLIALMDLAPRLSTREQERAIGEADRQNLIDPETLRSELEQRPGQAGVGPLKRTLDRRTFVLTHTELERRFLPIARRAGLPPPTGQHRTEGGRLDFHWPELGLVVETDGLTYHRTAARQSEDLARDHAHAAGGRVALRFSHAQITYEPGHVEDTLTAVRSRLRAG